LRAQRWDVSRGTDYAVRRSSASRMPVTQSSSSRFWAMWPISRGKCWPFRPSRRPVIT